MSGCFETKPFTDEFTTDASLEGWGVVYKDQHFYEPWEDEEDTLIDELELMTVLVALQILPILKSQANLRVFCDNTVANAYIKYMGGKVKRLDIIARQIWDLLEKHDAFLTATYVQSAKNVADKFTRGFSQETKRFFDLEVQLNPSVFRQKIWKKGPFIPQIDWFASNANKQLPRFCAWKEGTDGAEYRDAFMHNWGSEPGYLFPPFALLPKVQRPHLF